jgi:predicted metal-dependent phosphoesterase TrpH
MSIIIQKPGKEAEMAQIDLHMHSYYSCDGQYSPEALVKMAAQRGFKAIALTDHNSVKGVPEFLAAGKKYGIQAIPGIEIDTVYRSREYHILGYHLDWDDPRLAQLTQAIDNAQVELIKTMVRTVNELGYAITYADVLRYTNQKSIPGFASIAKAVLADKPGLDMDCFKFMQHYLAPNTPADFLHKLPKAEEIIQLISELNGVPVLAHPGVYIDPNQIEAVQVLADLNNAGLKGIEAYSTYHKDADNHKFHQLGLDAGLLITAGSDFHGEFKPSVALGQNCATDYPVLQALNHYA